MGQLLTYAAGLEAVTVVWIAGRFTDEHRATINWLNDTTDPEISFFAVQIELWRIGDSPIAPRFDVICAPNGWSRVLRRSAEGRSVGPLSPKNREQIEYWTAFGEYLRDDRSPIRPRQPVADPVAHFSIGTSDFYLYARAGVSRKTLGAGLVLAGSQRRKVFQELHRAQHSIEAELGFPPIWDEGGQGKYCFVYIESQDFQPADRKDWPRQHAWLRDRLEAFHQVFAGRLRALKHDSAIPETAADA